MDDPCNKIQLQTIQNILFIHALRQIINYGRITIEDRVLEGFTKYSKGIQGVPKARTSVTCDQDQ